MTDEEREAATVEPVGPLLERSVRQLVTTVWLAPTARRRYLTKRAAIRAEAKALIQQRYPTERSHADEFERIEDPGWHWSALPRADVLFRRVCRLVGKAAHAGNKPPQVGLD